GVERNKTVEPLDQPQQAVEVAPFMLHAAVKNTAVFRASGRAILPELVTAANHPRFHQGFLNDVTVDPVARLEVIGRLIAPPGSPIAAGHQATSGRDAGMP